jgi:hypothetical protein
MVDASEEGALFYLDRVRLGGPGGDALSPTTRRHLGARAAPYYTSIGGGGAGGRLH